MSGQSLAVAAADPGMTYEALKSDASTALVDVRTRAEWAFVGVPDIQGTGRPFWAVEWMSYPTMAPNAGFVAQLREFCGADVPARMFFICRSGQRSYHAAEAVAEAFDRDGLSVVCVNVVEGFEGDLDGAGHRGTVSGWKARGLPWRQT